MSTRLRSAEDSPLARFAAIVAEASAAGAELAPEHLAVALGSLERVRVELWARLSVPATTDRLLTAEQACVRLGLVRKDGTPDTAALYRRKWPFRVEVSPGRTRYSEQGIVRFIRARAGR